MATKEKQKGESKPKGERGGGGGSSSAGGGGASGGGKSRRGREAAEAAPKVPHSGVGRPAPAPRLREFYAQKVKPKLMADFGYRNAHEVPTLRKIVVNVGVGEAIKQPKVLDKVVEELSVITGQRPVRKRAKRSIANFGLREGQEIGAAVTLRGARMWEFLDRFISVAIPRIRDFRGLSPRSFDGHGNYSIGLKEQLIFPEINYDMVEQVHGMDVTVVTNAKQDDRALALLRELGMPFRDADKGGRQIGA